MTQVIICILFFIYFDLACSEILQKWSTPIYFEDLWPNLEKQQEINKKLEHAALYLEANVPGVYKSNTGGYQSNVFNSFSPHGLPVLHELEKAIIGAAKKFYLRGLQPDVSFDDKGKRVNDFLEGKSGVLELFSLWINVNRDGNSNLMHTHSDCFMSGAYYVAMNKDEYPASIVFSDPRTQPSTSYDYAGWFGMSQNLFVDPSPGKVVLFPSWIQHRVDILEGKGPRISIAFNIRMRARKVADALASSDMCNEGEDVCS